jgi:hypothetical protein
MPLAYLVSLVDSAKNKAGDPDTATSLITLICDEEEQAQNPSDIMRMGKRYFPKAFYPQTPVMMAKGWSPISSMLERQLIPIVLNRKVNGGAAVATGIWKPAPLEQTKKIGACKTVEELFWAIIQEAFSRASKRRCLVNIIAEPGWDYDEAIGSLPTWKKHQLVKMDRILWKRTPEG